MSTIDFDFIKTETGIDLDYKVYKGKLESRYAVGLMSGMVNMIGVIAATALLTLTAMKTTDSFPDLQKLLDSKNFSQIASNAASLMKPFLFCITGVALSAGIVYGAYKMFEGETINANNDFEVTRSKFYEGLEYASVSLTLKNMKLLEKGDQLSKEERSTAAKYIQQTAAIQEYIRTGRM